MTRAQQWQQQGPAPQQPVRPQPQKIGTLTFHRAVNNGAVLQAYALQQAIMGLGYRTEIVGYDTPYFDRVYRRAPRRPRALVRWLLSEPWRLERFRNFDRFARENLVIGEPVDAAGMARLPERYGAVVVGSDQVWRLGILGGDEAYFLPAPAPEGFKRSYAASMGVAAFEPGEEARSAGLLADFWNLCVRERTAADYLGALLGREVVQAADPVLLLPRGRWERLARRPRLERPYVLLFAMGYADPPQAAYARGVADSLGVELVVLQDSWHPVRGADHVVRGAGPAEFLGLIRGAEAVVTCSFHACCFSILFERELHWLVTPGTASSAPRIADLLAAFGLGGCRVVDGGRPLGRTDWGAVRPLVEAERGRSLAILEEILAGPGGGRKTMEEGM